MTLYRHQNKIIQDDPKKCGLFLGTGSGKTKIALLLAHGATLVVCPKTVKEDGLWEREHTKLKSKNGMIVISKEEFRTRGLSYAFFNTLIIDEAHTVLGASPYYRWRHKKQIPKVSQVCEALFRYVAQHQPSRIYLLTATITRNPMCVWAAGRLLGKQWGFSAFRQKCYFKLPMDREIWQVKKDKATKEWLGKAVRSIGYTGKLDDYFEVPEQTYKTEWIGLTSEQNAMIERYALEYPDPLVFTGKAHQIENGIMMGNEFRKTEYFENEKIRKILQYAGLYPRMVIFAKYIAQLEMIERIVRKAGYTTFMLDGRTKRRKELLEGANNAQKGIFLCQSSMGQGWELPDYPVAVFASLSYSVVDHVQAEGRILRANKLKENLFITLVVRGGVDEAVYECIKDKKDFLEYSYAKKRSTISDEVRPMGAGEMARRISRV